jgi:hypothetical protein
VCGGGVAYGGLGGEQVVSGGGCLLLGCLNTLAAGHVNMQVRRWGWTQGGWGCDDGHSTACRVDSTSAGLHRSGVMVLRFSSRGEWRMHVC